MYAYAWRATARTKSGKLAIGNKSLINSPWSPAADSPDTHTWDLKPHFPSTFFLAESPFQHAFPGLIDSFVLSP